MPVFDNALIAVWLLYNHRQIANQVILGDFKNRKQGQGEKLHTKKARSYGNSSSVEVEVTFRYS